MRTIKHYIKDELTIKGRDNRKFSDYSEFLRFF